MYIPPKRKKSMPPPQNRPQKQIVLANFPLFFKKRKTKPSPLERNSLGLEKDYSKRGGGLRSP